MSRKVEKQPAGVDDPGVEAGRVRRWRRDRFYELGFTLSEATKLADSDADLGDTRRLIGCGCPQPTALRILL